METGEIPANINLLPEADALRLKQGLYVTGETALRALLEDLGE